ncbi:MAG: ribosomal protein S18-alanine N-acetyltransferase [Candidatus Njordarchaeales archaeon]
MEGKSHPVKPSEITIRKASIEDVEEIFEIEKLSFKRPYPKYYLQWLIEGLADIFLVAEVNGKIIGYIAGRVEYGNLGHIVTIAVHPNWRRKGLGTMLMRKILNYFRKNSCKKAYLEVRVSNEPAIKLYQRLGFRKVRIIKHYYEDGEDAFLMAKFLE